MQQQKMIAQGQVPITKHDVNPYNGTLVNCQTIITDSEGISITM